MENLNFAQSSKPSDYQRSHVVVFTSGKAGVGKTCITINVATAMAQRGARVCFLDADTGLGNINIQLGLHPEYTLEHVLNGEKSIREVVIKTKSGVAVLFGAARIAEFANLEMDKVARLSLALTELETEYEYFLIDTATGEAEGVLQLIESAPYTFIMITPDPTSLTDAFTVLKRLNERDYSGRVRVIVNMATDYPSATETYRRFASAVEKYLDLKVEYGGFVVRDENLPESVAQLTPVIDLGQSPASRSLYALADNMLKYIGADTRETGLADYWTNFFLEKPAQVEDTLDYPQLSSEVSKHQETNWDDNVETAVTISQPFQFETETQLTTNLSLDELTAQLLATIYLQTTERDKLERFTSEFLEVFLTHFGSYPQVFSQLMFRWLEAENYAAPRLLELMGTLETLYVNKHQQPIHSIEDSAARLVSQYQGSSDNLGNLIKQLRTAYRQTFQTDVFDAKQEILDWIKRYDFSEEYYLQLQDSLGQAYQDRFKRPYRHQSDYLLASTIESLTAIGLEEQNLQQQLDAISEAYKQLNSRRNAIVEIQVKSKVSV